jgi:hypothetical protein
VVANKDLEAINLLFGLLQFLLIIIIIPKDNLGMTFLWKNTHQILKLPNEIKHIAENTKSEAGVHFIHL